MAKTLSDEGLDLIFRDAHTANEWDGSDISSAMVQAVYDLMKWGPTSANSCPGRFVFVKSAEAKERLKPHVAAGNRDKTMAAPVTAIVAYDSRFYELMPQLFPHNPKIGDVFSGNAELAAETAFRNGSLQGAYLIVAARALGLDCGPMSGFNREGVDKEFFPDGRWRSNFLCNIGHAKPGSFYPRNPRLEFDEACELL
ncbi:MAG: malonic semialdehyde reductase [Alphaproteobacteria bacterium]|nr:malonic semialdehyde reductase [Alphaproteobacteria bacterium]